jgi:hypothetical protein
VQRVAPIFLLVFSAGLITCLPAVAEEILLKDGTKIVGHMTAVTADKIEVETAYGKMQLKRTDILTISFPENGAAGAPAPGTAPGGTPETAPLKKDLPKIDDVLNGTQYLNRTGRFSLTLPAEWMINPDLRRLPETVAALSSRDKMRYLLVVQEEYPGSLDSYKDLSLLTARRTLGNYEELSESPVTIDGKKSMLIFYRGNLTKGNNLPLEFLTAIIGSGSNYTRVTIWCVEPLFRDMQPAFEKIVNSYHSTGQSSAVAASSKP